MTSRNRWRFAFLLFTGLVLGMELVAAFDGRIETDPWTSLIVLYVPAPVTYTAIAVLAAWLPVHFWRRYQKRAAAERASRRAALRQPGPTSTPTD